MKLLDVVKQRRSVRKYKFTLPKDEDIEKTLEAGRWAPSGLNNQPWRFLVIKDKIKKDNLAKFTKYGHIITNAPVALCVFMDIATSYNHDKDIMAIGACVQNMLLQAHSLGLGSCWLGEILNQKEKVQNYLKTDSDLELMAVITLGYPEEKTSKGSRESLTSLLVKGQ